MTPIEGKILAADTNNIRNISDRELDMYAHNIKWGTFGPTGDAVMKVRVVNDLDTEHLENILITQRQISFLMSRVILHVLKGRYKNNK